MRFSAAEVLAEIGRQAPTFGVNPEVARAFFMAENSADGSAASGRGDAVSPKGAQGIMQVMPATARGLQKAGFLPADWKHDPANLANQVMAGLATIKEMAGRAKNPDDVFELAAMYNGGNAAHKAYLTGGQLPTETVGYFGKVANATGLKPPGTFSTSLSTSTKAPGLTMTATSSTPTTGDSTAALSSSRGSSTSRSVFDPGALDLYTNAVMGAIGTGGSLDAASDAVIAGGASRVTNLAAMKDAIAGRAKAAGAEAEATAAVESAAAVRKANILTSLNLNPAATDNEMLAASQAINLTDAAMLSLKPEIDKRMAVGFFDNPFQWLVNQTILPGLVNQYNSSVENQNKAVDRFKTLQTIAAGQQSISAGIDADEITRKGIAVKDRIAADAAIDLAKAQESADAGAARDALTLAQVAGTKASLAAGLLQTTKEVRTEREGASEREKQGAKDAALLEQVNKVIVASGGAPIADIAAFKALPAKSREALIENATSGKFGKDFTESFTFLKGVGNMETLAAKGGAAVRQWVNGTYAKAGEVVAAEKKQADALGKKFDGEAATKAALLALQRQYQADAAVDMRTASEHNPFKLQYVNIARIPELANNPLAIFINTYGPQGKEPRFAKVDEQYLLQRFAFSVANGKMKPADAVNAITEFYKVGTAEQRRYTSWNLFGLEQPEKTYPVSLPVGPTSLFGSTTANTVDLGDITSVENIITKLVASQSKERFGATNSIYQPGQKVNPLSQQRN